MHIHTSIHKVLGYSNLPSLAPPPSYKQPQKQSLSHRCTQIRAVDLKSEITRIKEVSIFLIPFLFYRFSSRQGIP